MHSQAKIDIARKMEGYQRNNAMVWSYSLKEVTLHTRRILECSIVDNPVSPAYTFNETDH